MMKYIISFSLLFLLSCSTYYQIPDEIKQEQARHIIRGKTDDLQLSPIEQISTEPPRTGILFVKAQRLENWGVKYLEADKVPALLTKLGLSPNRRVHVFIMDTSGDYEHDLLKDIQADGRSFTGEALRGTNGHSPHVAGSIAAATRPDGGELGVASILRKDDLIRLYPYKVLKNNGSGSYTNVIQGTEYANTLAKSIQAANDIAQLLIARGDFVIYNYSLGGGSSTRLSQALADAARIGVLMVAATGNDGRNSLSFPGSDKSTVSVGAIDSKGNRAYFSNYGTGIDFVGPGVGILSTQLGQNYTTYNGTSMATPHVAGAFAVAASVFKNASAADLIAHFRKHSDRAGKWSSEYGYGAPKLVNILSNPIASNPSEPEPEPEPEPTPEPGPEVRYTFTIPQEYSVLWRTMSNAEMNRLFFTGTIEIKSRAGVKGAAQEAKQITDTFFRNRFFVFNDGADELEVAKWVKVFYKMLTEKAGHQADLVKMKLNINGIQYLYDQPTARNAEKEAVRKNVVTGTW